MHYFSLRRRPSEIILFQRVNTCLKLFRNYFTGLLQLMNIVVVVRPSEIVCRPTYMYILPGFFLSFFFFLLFRQLFELAERNSTTIGHVLGSNCNLKTHVRNLRYPLPRQLGTQKPPFGLTSQLNGNFNSLYLWNETRYRQSVKCVDNYDGVSYIVPKRHKLWSTNGFKLDRHFYPPYVNSAFHFIVTLRRRRSANRTQPNFAKRWTVRSRSQVVVEKLGSSLPNKMGAKELLHLFSFSTTSRLNGEYLLN